MLRRVDFADRIELVESERAARAPRRAARTAARELLLCCSAGHCSGSRKNTRIEFRAASHATAKLHHYRGSAAGLAAGRPAGGSEGRAGAVDLGQLGAHVGDGRGGLSVANANWRRILRIVNEMQLTLVEAAAVVYLLNQSTDTLLQITPIVWHLVLRAYAAIPACKPCASCRKVEAAKSWRMWRTR